MFAGAYSMPYIWDLYTLREKVYPMRIVVPTLLFVSSSSALMFVKKKLTDGLIFVISILQAFNFSIWKLCNVTEVSGIRI